MSDVQDVIDGMNTKVNEMPLSTWLHAINKSIPFIGKDHAMREFVVGMHHRGLAYHWDDFAGDCLCGVVPLEDSAVIQEIVEQLHCEDMFTLSLQLMEESGGVIESEYLHKRNDERVLGLIADSQGNALGVHSCFCDIKDLATHGCKCGGC